MVVVCTRIIDRDVIVEQSVVAGGGISQNLICKVCILIRYKLGSVDIYRAAMIPATR